MVKKHWNMSLYCSIHSEDWLLFAGIMEKNEVEKLEEKLIGLVEYREYIFDGRESQLKTRSKGNKINKSDIIVGKYYSICQVIHNYWIDNNLEEDKNITSDEAIEILLKYGKLIFEQKETLF